MAIKVVREITADVVKRGSTRAIYAKQHDFQSRFLNVRIQEDGTNIQVAPDLTVILNVERSDKAEKQFYGTVNDDGSVKVPLTAWMLDLEGTLVCDISIVSEDPEVAKLTTMQFSIFVEAATVTDENIKDTEEYSVIVDLLERTTAAESAISKAEERANQVVEDLTEVAQSLDDFKIISGGDAYTSTFEGTSLDTLIKWSCLGDSITDVRFNRPKNYPYWINANNPSVTIQNLGISGALICFDRDNILEGDVHVNSLYTQAKSISPDVDVITIFGGVNDYNWSVPLGTFTTDLTGYPTSKVATSKGGGTVADGGGIPNNGTFYQGCYRLAKYLRETYPYKPIVWFTPMTFGVGNSEGKDVKNKYNNTIYEFMDAIKEVAAYFSIPCYDLGRQCSITPRIQAMQDKYYLDNLHPNAEGSLILSRIIERETKKVLMEWGTNL